MCQLFVTSEIEGMNSKRLLRYGRVDMMKPQRLVMWPNKQKLRIVWHSMTLNNLLIKSSSTPSMDTSCEEELGGIQWKWLPWLHTLEVP